MIKCAIMQPTYLPWAGYFNLISEVDHFVFLDDVQFEKQSWQNRNRILLNGQPHWLTVPVKRESLGQKIYEIKLDRDLPWRTKQIKTLKNLYSKSPFKDDLEPIISVIEDSKVELLSHLNTEIIRLVAKNFNLKTKFHFSRALNVFGERSERLIKICLHLGATCYLSPPGAREYIEKDGAFRESIVELKYHTFEPAPYIQDPTAEFISYLSIVDILPRLGWKSTRDYCCNSTS